MNVEQATELLLALGSDDHGDHRDAIRIVLDLLAEVQVVVEPPSVNQAMLDAMHKRLAELDAREKLSTPFPGPPRSMNEANADIARLKHENEILTAAVETWAELWGRIEKLVGTGPQRASEVTIDRIAYLAEEEKTRPTKQRFDELQTDRNELLAAARKFVEADDSVSGRYALVLADVVAKINAREDT